jgi:ribonuclease J
MSEVKVTALGGVGEIGKNCTVVEQGEDLVIIDAGLSFPSEEMHGVDIVIPDFTYLVQKRHNIRGVFLTHAHEDHVGSLPYLLKKLNIPVYASEFTHALIRSKLEESITTKNLKLQTFKPGDIIECGSLKVEPIRVTHSIPETCSIAVHTNFGVVLFTSDFKLDFTPVDKKLTNLGRFAELGKEGVLLLLSDSTNVDRKGWGPSESEVSIGLKQVFTEAPGRVLITTFASNIHRLQQAYYMAAETGRVVGVVGRRMEQNVDICVRYGYLNIPKGTRVNLDELRDYPPEKQVILTTGSQGEPMSALVQMSREEYGRFQVREGDTLIYSARPIPGNEASIWRTINRLFRLGVNVLYDPVSKHRIHVSGHAYQEELKMMINLTKPYYLAPVHGEDRHQHLYLQMAKEMGHPEHRMFKMQAGIPLCITETNAEFGEPVPCGKVLVDNAGTPGVSDDILRDRHNLANEGVVTITVTVDSEHHYLVGEPIVMARGFNGGDQVLNRTALAVADDLAQVEGAELQDMEFVKDKVSKFARRYIYKHTNLRPLILPIVVEV